ncbi:jouberin-like isoform X2 [Bombus huntii]|uniref:jouberin-like isoform X2 n=1 Tax=Bombus huntii TaxID=85661 RepID=UPI0021AAB9EE|nr:jouberin-like isoform X2 [Bombus huntii]
MELQIALTKNKKKRQNETNLRPLINKTNYKTNFQDSDDEHSFSNNANTTEDMEDSFPMFNRDTSKLFTNTDSMNSSEFASKSVDVIVDIHQEYKEEELHDNNIEHGGASNKKNSFLKESENVKAFSTKTNLKHENLSRDDDDIKVVDSLDLIEEFGESLVTKKNGKEIQTVSKNKLSDKLSKKNINQSSVEVKLHGRKQWITPKDEKEEVKKPTRKRWSKDNTVIRLPETRNTSWTIVSSESASSFVQRSEKPLPATRSFLKKSLFGFDNEAFDSEEILTIETDHNRSNPKIRMKRMVHNPEQMELSTFDSRSIRNSLSEENKSFKETAIVTEDLKESANLDSETSENRRRNAILDVERIDKFNRGDISLKDRMNRGLRNKRSFVEKSNKNTSNSSNSSQSLEEITAQSDDDSKEVSIKDDRFLIRSGRKHSVNSRRHSKENSLPVTEDDLDEDRLKHSSQYSVTTSENDDFDENRAKATNDEAKLKRSKTKKKKSKFIEHQLQKKDKEKRLSKNLTPSVNIEESSKRKKKRKKKDDIKYISVTIHRTDVLEIDYVTKHPMVKVHIVKAENGKYLKNEHGACTYLQPVITGKFDFKENKSIVPVWEEELIFEHDFKELLKIDNEQVVILFEIVDLLSFAEASFNYDKFGHEGCWYKVAWAFLKPVGRNQVLHINKKVRLQLYKPRKNSQKFDRFHTCEVYTWWKSNVREKYPSSLFVTAKSINQPRLEPVLYRQLSLYDLSNIRNESHGMSVHTSNPINLPKWTRLAAQSCKIPNEIFFETDIGENGCFYIAFSNDGKYLACCFSEEHDYPIVVYENRIVEHIQMMPHPSYVYCGKFDPDISSIVVTGCYDRIARIWIEDKKSKNWDLSQELEGHEGFINSMYFQKNSNLLTADSVGIIIIWMLKKSRKISSMKEWYISRKIKVREIDGIIINTIILHPLESRLLVHSRNNGLRMLDLATGVVLQKYNELNNQRIQSTACISPCGNLIFCGGEDSSLNVWNLETGNLLAKYTFDRHYRAVTCVDYHPYDHILAFSTFGSSASVRILRFNKDGTGEDIGLRMMRETENTVNNSDVPMRFLKTSVMPKEKLRSNNSKKVIEEAYHTKEKSLQSNRSHNSSLLKFSDSVFEKDKYSDVMYHDTKIKLQRLNEVGQTMKIRNTNRLYNIIEKIDRILSNSSKSSGDIESGRNFTLLQQSSESEVLTFLNENIEKQKKKLKKNKSAYLTIEDQSSSYFESNTTSSDKPKIVECYTLQSERTNDWNRKERSRSAKEMRNSNISKDDTTKTFSDSATNYQKIKAYDEITKTLLQENIEPDFAIEMEENNKKSITYKSNRLRKDDSDSTDSAGTYIIEKNDIKGSDKDSTKMFENRNIDLNDTENDSNIKDSRSGSSVLSSATFTIENEISISTPKKNGKSSLK